MGPASLPRRLAAFGIDYLVLSLYIGALSLLGILLRWTVALEYLFAHPLRAQLFVLAVLTLPVVLYFALWESSSRRATPGKRVAGLQVVTVDGKRLTRSRSLLRTAVKFAPWEMAHTFLWRIPGWPGSVEALPPAVVVGFVAVWLLVGLYLLMPLTTRLHQTPYDRLVGSVVIDGRRAGDPVV